MLCFPPWKEGLHLSHSHAGKILVCNCLEMWCWEHLPSCLVFAQKEETLSFYPHEKVFPGTFMAHLGKYKRKNGFHQLRFIHVTIISCCFLSKFLFLKPFPQLLYWVSYAFFTSCFFPLFSFRIRLVFFLWVCLLSRRFVFHLYFLNSSPGSSFPACH